MNLRKQLSITLRGCKDLSGKTYAELIDETGCSQTAIRYALNGGEKTGLDTFQKLFDCMEAELEISVLD